MNKNKRDVLKSLAVGSVWAAPVVSSVILPAHASASGCTGCFSEGPNNSVMLSSISDDVLEVSFYEGEGNNDCQGSSTETIFGVLTNSEEEAMSIMNTHCNPDCVDAFSRPPEYCGITLWTFACQACESDIRLKSDIQPLGKTTKGLDIYRFKYLNDPTQTDYVGVMAQDLVESHPNSLVLGDDGFYKVKYNELGIRMIKYSMFEKDGLEALNLNH
jgi:hypothetical protein